ncbi:MAG: MraZ family transcriptional regulator [Coriobacteriales bacterium]|nr:MraZ family transcriptional regulator [Coriobacteriales bacterium]
MDLTGAKQFNLDAKGRLTLPANYRKQFDKQLRLIPLEDALYGFTPEGFKEWVEGMFTDKDGGFDPRNPEDVELHDLLYAMATTIDIDSAGRIALGKIDASDPTARQRLGIEGEVVVTGAGDHFKVMSTQAWAAKQENYAARIAKLMYRR